MSSKFDSKGREALAAAWAALSGIPSIITAIAGSSPPGTGTNFLADDITWKAISGLIVGSSFANPGYVDFGSFKLQFGALAIGTSYASGTLESYAEDFTTTCFAIIASKSKPIFPASGYGSGDITAVVADNTQFRVTLGNANLSTTGAFTLYWWAIGD